MTIRERIIGWLGGVDGKDAVARDVYRELAADWNAHAADLRGQLEEAHEARRTAFANFEQAEAERVNLSRRLDAVRRAITDDDLPV